MSETTPSESESTDTPDEVETLDARYHAAQCAATLMSGVSQFNWTTYRAAVDEIESIIKGEDGKLSKGVVAKEIL